MRIAFSVQLPTEASSVPFVRGLCRQALEHLQVDAMTIADVTLALTEACANVVDHAEAKGDYQVEVHLDGDTCRLSVVDSGTGFDLAAVPAQPTDTVLEGGRGLHLMQALVDDLRFQHDPDGRHRVVLEKVLRAQAALRLVTPPDRT